MADGPRRAIDWEAWSERQIREATERGDFDGLPGTGKPIPDLGKPHDELWWLKDKLRRENVSWLPPSLQARKEVEDAVHAALTARSEAEARQIIARINERIRALLRIPPPGPPFNLMPLDVDQVAARWRATHPEPEPAPPPEPPPPPARRWRRSWRRTQPRPD